MDRELLLMYSRLSLLTLLLTLSFSPNLWALDIVKVTNSESSEFDKRSAHKNELIKRSLELTVPEYGAYKFIIQKIRVNRYRALSEILKGKVANIYIGVATEEWNNKTIPIKIPVRKGLLNYRLLMIHENDLETFSRVETLEDLKGITAGLRSGWVTTKVFQEAEMNLVVVQNFDGLFMSLNNHRFSYIPRAIYEIFNELISYQDVLNHVVVEPTLVLHLPMPTYVYVSPSEPRIAKRIEKGLKIMLGNGEFDQILNKYYSDDIERADLKNRKIIKMDNPYYIDKSLLNDDKLWY